MIEALSRGGTISLENWLVTNYFKILFKLSASTNKILSKAHFSKLILNFPSARRHLQFLEIPCFRNKFNFKVGMEERTSTSTVGGVWLGSGSTEWRSGQGIGTVTQRSRVRSPVHSHTFHSLISYLLLYFNCYSHIAAIFITVMGRLALCRSSEPIAYCGSISFQYLNFLGLVVLSNGMSSCVRNVILVWSHIQK